MNGESDNRGSAMTKRGVYAAVSYMACAVLLLMFNKAVLSSYTFPCVNMISLFQMICSCLFLYTMRHWKIISFTVDITESATDSPATIVPLKKLICTIPLAISYLLYMVVSMESVRGVNVPMYTTLRRTTVAFTMIAEYLLAGKKYSYSVLGREKLDVFCMAQISEAEELMR